MNDDINPSLMQMLRDIGSTKQEIESQTLVYHDLGIAGDDAHELLAEIHREFGTSFTELNFNEYFPDETEVLWYHLARKFGFWNKKHIALSVGKLDESIKRGKWIEAN